MPPNAPKREAADHRARLLSKLGIQESRAPSAQPARSDPSCLRGAVPYKEPLKRDQHSGECPTNTPLKKDLTKEPPVESELNQITEDEKETPKQLTFDESVKVVPIPERHEYSERIRSRLWTNATDLYENAQRNTVEFAAEGWNWRSVATDEKMYICRYTGELIHPVHCEQFYHHEGTADELVPSQDEVSSFPNR